MRVDSRRCCTRAGVSVSDEQRACQNTLHRDSCPCNVQPRLKMESIGDALELACAGKHPAVRDAVLFRALSMLQGARARTRPECRAAALCISMKVEDAAWGVACLSLVRAECGVGTRELRDAEVELVLRMPAKGLGSPVLDFVAPFSALGAHALGDVEARDAVEALAKFASELFLLQTRGGVAAPRLVAAGGVFVAMCVLRPARARGRRWPRLMSVASGYARGSVARIARRMSGVCAAHSCAECATCRRFRPEARACCAEAAVLEGM